jgi:hypothetical protein
MKPFFVIGLMGLVFVVARAQQPLQGFTQANSKGVICQAIVEHQDTIPYVTLDAIIVNTSYIFKNADEQRAWTRIRKRVQKVYPYAVLAGIQIRNMDHQLSLIKSEKDQHAYLKAEEQRLKNNFENELKALNFQEGQILLKLINRESGKTTFDIIKQFKGTFQAYMYQGIARLFGYNTKETYSAAFEDVMIERAVREVVSGS